jgi:hypothetical protein
MAKFLPTLTSRMWVIVCLFVLLTICAFGFYLKESFKVHGLENQLSLIRLELQSVRYAQEAQAIINSREISDLKNISSRFNIFILKPKIKKITSCVGVVLWDTLLFEGDVYLTNLPHIKSGSKIKLTYSGKENADLQNLGIYNFDLKKNEVNIHFKNRNISNTGRFTVRIIGEEGLAQNPEGYVILQSP